MVIGTRSTHKKERGPHVEKGADHALSRFLDVEKRSTTACQLEHAMREKIVGQDEAVQALVDLYQVFCAGLHSPGRPVGNLLFLGPTGSGKTHTFEAAAEILFGDNRAVIKVDCGEFQVHQSGALVIDHHFGEEGLVFSRDKENRSSDLPLPISGELMTAEARA